MLKNFIANVLSRIKPGIREKLEAVFEKIQEKIASRMDKDAVVSDQPETPVDDAEVVVPVEPEPEPEPEVEQKPVFTADAEGSTVAGGSEDDLIYGQDGDDVLIGAGGNDDMYGYGGNDRLYGGADDDTLRGGDGNDQLNGEKGNDSIIGGKGVDQLYGSEGNDTLLGTEGLDFLSGGADADQFVLQSQDADAPINYAGHTVDNADVITDLSFAEGDIIRLLGFDNVLAEAGIDQNIDTMLELSALAGAADSVEDFQSNSVVMTITDDDGASHLLRLMDYSVADLEFDFV